MILLLRYKFRMVINTFLNLSSSEIAKFSFLSLIGISFGSILYWGFLRLLRAIHGLEIIGDLLMLKMMALVFLSMFVMVVFSSILISFTTLFFARDITFLSSFQGCFLF